MPYKSELWMVSLHTEMADGCTCPPVSRPTHTSQTVSKSLVNYNGNQNIKLCYSVCVCCRSDCFIVILEQGTTNDDQSNVNMRSPELGKNLYGVFGQNMSTWSPFELYLFCIVSFLCSLKRVPTLCPSFFCFVFLSSLSKTKENKFINWKLSRLYS